MVGSVCAMEAHSRDVGLRPSFVASPHENTFNRSAFNSRRLQRQRGGQKRAMSFTEHDRRTFIIDSAGAYSARKISKREFLRRMGLAGIGFSSFGLAMLGGYRRARRNFSF